MIVMSGDLEADILNYMKSETINGRIIFSIPGIMNAFKISRSKAAATIAVLMKEGKVSEVKGRSSFYFVSEIMDLCARAWEKNT